MTAQDDNPIPEPVPMRGAAYWLRVARANLGPRRQHARSRWSSREALHEQASYDAVYPEEQQ